MGEWLSSAGAWFDRQSDAVKVSLIISAVLIAGFILWSFVFYGADYGGFGDWLQGLMGA